MSSVYVQCEHKIYKHTLVVIFVMITFQLVFKMSVFKRETDEEVQLIKRTKYETLIKIFVYIASASASQIFKRIYMAVILIQKSDKPASICTFKFIALVG